MDFSAVQGAVLLVVQRLQLGFPAAHVLVISSTAQLVGSSVHAIWGGGEQGKQVRIVGACAFIVLFLNSLLTRSAACESTARAVAVLY